MGRVEASDLWLVVPVHGHLDVTRRFLDSFDRQTVRCPLMLVDDASPDNSVDWLRSNGWEVHVPCRRLWYNGVVNWAVSTAAVPYFGILNNDLVLGRHFVAETIRAFERSSYDVLVPRAVNDSDQDALDRARNPVIRSLWRQQGWCMLFRLEAVRRLPPIPSNDLRLWYGDTWLFHHAWSCGLRVGIMRHVWVFHERSVTVGDEASPAREVIEQDQEAVRLCYPWLRKRRPLGRLRCIPRPLRRHILPHIP
ncbi:MAG: glycosyltransferase [Candidatus Eisenbacteria bacterium]|nr:glycosyltransferase [Candidatus Eisenbacteria bacterium]